MSKLEEIIARDSLADYFIGQGGPGSDIAKDRRWLLAEVAALSRENESLVSQNETLRAALSKYGFTKSHAGRKCNSCGYFGGVAHKEGCEVVAALSPDGSAMETKGDAGG